MPRISSLTSIYENQNWSRFVRLQNVVAQKPETTRKFILLGNKSGNLGCPVGNCLPLTLIIRYKDKVKPPNIRAGMRLDRVIRPCYSHTGTDTGPM